MYCLPCTDFYKICRLKQPSPLDVKEPAEADCVAFSEAILEIAVHVLPDEELFAQLVGKYNTYFAKPVVYGKAQYVFCRIMLNINKIMNHPGYAISAPFLESNTSSLEG